VFPPIVELAGGNIEMIRSQLLFRGFPKLVHAEVLPLVLSRGRTSSFNRANAERILSTPLQNIAPISRGAWALTAFDAGHIVSNNKAGNYLKSFGALRDAFEPEEGAAWQPQTRSHWNEIVKNDLANELAPRGLGAHRSGTPGGRFMRRFWMAVCRSQDLTKRATKPIRIMSVDYALYRGESGRAHVIDYRCPHRGAQMHLGWVEGDDIRCIYHGWKYDCTGQCVEQPAEDSQLCQ